MTSDKGILISNIYYMLSYVYQNLRQDNYINIESESFENVLDLLAVILAKGITKQLKQGLSRNYIEESDALSTLRGKINLRESMYLDMRNSRRISCTYDEFSANHIMNRILKTAAWYLICSNDVKSENKEVLKRAFMLHMHEISILQPSEINWRSLHYHRNNLSYKMLMNICFFVLHDLLLTTKDGKYKLAQYFDDRQMSALYEKFILAYYANEHSCYKPGSPSIAWDVDGDSRHLPSMYTDIVLTMDGGRKKLIIDAKYHGKVMQSQYEGSAKFKSENLYQMFTYVKNEDKDQSGKVHGILLYAKPTGETVLQKDYIMGGNRIGVRTLDLSMDFRHIRNQLDEIAIEWAGWPQ